MNDKYSNQTVFFSGNIDEGDPIIILRGSCNATADATSYSITCSANTVPFGNTAKFFMDGDFVNNIRRYNNRCYRTVNSDVCQRNTCNCSGDGKSYTYIYSRTARDNASFGCSMNFVIKNKIQTHESRLITVKDIKGSSRYTRGGSRIS